MWILQCGSLKLPFLSFQHYYGRWGNLLIQTWENHREQLREQHELTQEIGNAITSMPITEPIDEDELEADLAALEQENLDEKMLKTGIVPVADSLNRLPKAANGESKFITSIYISLAYLLACLPYINEWMNG